MVGRNIYQEASNNVIILSFRDFQGPISTKTNQQVGVLAA
jgi:hypothetical protein